MEKEDIESIQNKELENLTEDYKDLEKKYDYSCKTFSEMNNNLNWIITLITGVLIYLTDNYLKGNFKIDTFNIYLGALILLILITIFNLFKMKYINFRRYLDKILWELSDHLRMRKSYLKYTERERLILTQECDYKFENPYESNPEDSFNDIGKKIDSTSSHLMFYYRFVLLIFILLIFYITMALNLFHSSIIPQVK